MSELFIGTMPVQEKHRFDLKALDRFMRENVEGFAGPLDVEQFKGGQSNPTFRLRTPGRDYVLRRKPPGKLLPSAHAVDREYRVIRALRDSDVPVAPAHALCMDEQVIGTAFYIMDFVEGRVFWDPRLPQLGKADRRPIFEEMNRVVAALHKVDYQAVGLGDFGKPGNYMARQIARWTRQYRESSAERSEAMDRLSEWLPENVPAGDETSIVHGDLRMDNMIFHPSEPRILAVLDWELSTLGHPLADFGYHCITWHVLPGDFRGLAGEDLDSLGIPSESEHLAAYCRRTGRDGVPDWEFYVAFNMFRLSAILQGILTRVAQGTAANPHAVEAAGRARNIAETGWRYVQAKFRV